MMDEVTFRRVGLPDGTEACLWRREREQQPDLAARDTPVGRALASGDIRPADWTVEDRFIAAGRSRVTYMSRYHSVISADADTELRTIPLPQYHNDAQDLIVTDVDGTAIHLVMANRKVDGWARVTVPEYDADDHRLIQVLSNLQYLRPDALTGYVKDRWPECTRVPWTARTTEESAGTLARDVMQQWDGGYVHCFIGTCTRVALRDVTIDHFLAAPVRDDGVIGR